MYNAPYEEQGAHTFTLTNTGTEQINNVTATPLPLGSAFEIIPPLSDHTLQVGGQVTIQVRPKAGHLSTPEPKTFKDTLSISGIGTEGRTVNLTVSLEFTVYPTHRIGFSESGINFYRENGDLITTPFADVRHGDDISIFITLQNPESRYITGVRVADGINLSPYDSRFVSLGAVGVVTFPNVSSNHQISVNAMSSPQNLFNIIAFAGAGGSFDQGLSTKTNPSPSTRTTVLKLTRLGWMARALMQTTLPSPCRMTCLQASTGSQA
jgi:hypothetical protein